MKRRVFTIVLALAMLLSLSVVGFGEETEPEYRDVTLKSAGDVQKLAKLCRLDSASRELRVTLAGDIDLSGCENLEIPSFGGIFDGGGHRLTGVRIETKGSNRGLFRYLQAGAEVRDLEVSGVVEPQGSAGSVGGLVGVNNGTIENVHFSGSVRGNDRVGGIAGTNGVTGKIQNCTVEGSLQGQKVLGGIVGTNAGIVYNCVNRADINTGVPEETLNLGDLTVSRLTSEETVRSGSDIGGVAGSSSGVIRQCRNEGDVGYLHTGYNVGGVAGSQSGFMADCVNFGDIWARKEGGGVLGQMEPSNLLVYSEDTLQKLQKELNAANSILARTASDASSANSSIQGGLVSVQNNLYDFLGAVDYMLEVVGDNTSVTFPEGELPDIEITNRDEVWAAAGYVGSCLTETVNALSHVSDIAAGEGGVVLGDLQSLAGQLNRVVNVMSGREEDTVLVEDVSGQDVLSDAPGKIRGCTNYGTVHADINAGGIVGALSWDNDLDPEDDLQVQGDTSLNFTYKTRALVYRCVNRGQVQAKKQAAGGIAGRSTLGAIVECEGYGLVHSENASWVGGIVGVSEAEVRDCWAKCQILGGELCGGVAGEASRITGCRALVTVENGGEYTGAIAGRLREDAEGERNYFVASDSLAGIDGISYAGLAEPVDYDAFMELDGVPGDFENMILTFVSEEKTYTRRVAYGQSLARIPEVPPREGYSGLWEGLNTENIQADQTVYAQYTPLLGAIDTGSDGIAPVVAEGRFLEGSHVTAEALTQLPENAVLGWRITLPEDGQDSHRIHLRAPESGEGCRVLVDTGEGWKETQAQEDGSYLVFSVEGQRFLAAVEPLEGGGPNWRLYGALGGGAALLTLLLLFRKGRRKQTEMRQNT